MNFVRRVMLFLTAALAWTPVAAFAQPSSDPQIETLMAQAREQLNVDPESSIAIAEKSVTLVKQRLNGGERDNYLSDIDALMSRALIRVGRTEDAAMAVKRGFARAKLSALSPRVMAELTLSLGRVHQYRDDVQLALRDFQMAYKLFRSVGDKRSQAVALQSIAKLYVDGGDGANALRYFKQSDDEYAGDPLMSLSSHNNRGMAHVFMSQPKEAEVEFRAALKIAESLRSSKYTIRVLVNLAQALTSQGRHETASTTVDRAFTLMNSSSETQEASHLWNLRAQIAFARKDMRTAGAAIVRALDGVDPETSESDFRQVHFNASQIYGAIGNTKLAYQNLRAVQRIDEMTAKLTATNAAALMAARFDFANQNTRIAQMKAREFELQRNFLIAVVAGGTLALVLLSVGLILITRSRNRERAGRLLLARTNVDLEKAIAAKMEFLATTSHEIRTPLNGILGMTQVMLADRQLDVQLRDRISIVHDAGEAMRMLVDDILDVAKMDTGNLTVGTGSVDLHTILQQATELWKLQADAKGVALVLDLKDCPKMMEGDEGRIRQIVTNLLSNAMKFTEKGRVELSGRSIGEPNNRSAEIFVRDSGLGIAPEWHESIFELFQQVDGGTTRKYGGTGLGLAICRNLARAMGGDIRVDSQPGQGSTFTISLPLVEAANDEGAAAAQRSAVIVIERNPLTRGILRAILAERFDAVLFADDEIAACGDAKLAGAEWIVADAASVDNLTVLLDEGGHSLVLIGGDADIGVASNVVRLPKPLSKSALLAAFGDAEDMLQVAA
jgi:signal transduction histidine kinase